MRQCIDADVAARLAAVEITVHATLESLDRTVYQIPADVPLSEMAISGEDEAGNEHEFGWEAYAAAAVENGGMGYVHADANPPTVDIWFSPSSTPAQQAFVLGHELGHIVDASLKTGGNDIAHEMRADAFGAVAAKVATLLGLK